MEEQKPNTHKKENTSKEEEITDITEVRSDDEFIVTDLFEDKKSKLHDFMHMFTFWKTDEQRRWIRNWIVYSIYMAIPLVFGFIAAMSEKDFWIGWLIGSFVSITIACVVRIPQLIFCCCHGYPVMHFLWLDGWEKPIFNKCF